MHLDKLVFSNSLKRRVLLSFIPWMKLLAIFIHKPGKCMWLSFKNILYGNSLTFSRYHPAPIPVSSCRMWILFMFPTSAASIWKYQEYRVNRKTGRILNLILTITDSQWFLNVDVCEFKLQNVHFPNRRPIWLSNKIGKLMTVRLKICSFFQIRDKITESGLWVFSIYKNAHLKLIGLTTLKIIFVIIQFDFSSFAVFSTYIKEDVCISSSVFHISRLNSHVISNCSFLRIRVYIKSKQNMWC